MGYPPADQVHLTRIFLVRSHTRPCLCHWAKSPETWPHVVRSTVGRKDFFPKTQIEIRKPQDARLEIQPYEVQPYEMQPYEMQPPRERL